ncbi:coiled-coil domain-containing protein 103 [Cataglyphis hispanica]|uniref:coiled-coil domain-containing protein 103 n=1 Tax=Cataglyphis hispanica TaxID=1086592 RepID=UPI00217F9AEF|nr:coiled-coil domain-containing protein 103 [Cataglyphis hispanica]
MSALKIPIDYKCLEEELQAALAADELYKLQNDAKIRAVEQGVPTYEHFRQMVNGAHLKPLDRNDMKPKIGVQWNPMINVTESHNSIISTAGKSKCNQENDKNITKKSPETYEDFVQSWRTITNHSEKFTYIWNLKNNLQNHIFRVEIPASFFSDFMDVCLQYLSDLNDVTSIIELLSILSTCNRFDLTICFMTKNERSICEQIFQQLQLKATSQDISLKNAIESLAVKYQIKIN